MGDFIRPRQRALTALSPHQGNQNIIVPKRLDLEPPDFSIIVGTDGGDERGFLRDGYGSIIAPPAGLVIDRLTINVVTHLIILEFSDGARPLNGPISLADDQLADNRLAHLVWDYEDDELPDNFFSIPQPTDERSIAWDAQLGSAVLINLEDASDDFIRLWERSYTTTGQNSSLGFLNSGTINHGSSGANNNPLKLNPRFWEWWHLGSASGIGELYEVFVSHVGGDVPSGPALDTWLGLGTNQIWQTQIVGVTTSIIEASVRTAGDQELLMDRRRSFLVRAV